MLLKNPSFTLIAAFTLALGIGANTAIFSVVNAVMLRPLPYPEPERLLTIGQQYQDGLAGAGEPKFLFWREHNQSFESMAAYSNFGGAGGNLSGGSEAEHVDGLRVSEDFFRVHGVYPMIGRSFTKAEDTPGAERTAILSYGLWQRRFGGDKDLIGKTVLLNDRAVTVVGVMPPNFRIASNIDLLTPMQAEPTSNHNPNSMVVGRLKPGVTIEQARAELRIIADQYRAAFPKQMQKVESIGVQPYQETFTAGVGRYLWILLGAVVFLLLIACANVANLQLTRAAGRQREIAVRMAIGANNGRIARQLLTEGVLLALIGGTVGGLSAVWGTELLVSTLPEGFLPSIAEIDVDWRVLLFAFATALATGLLFSLAPAWRAGRIDVNAALKENAGKGGTGRERLHGALVIAEVALSIVLLIGAGLLIRSFANLLNVAPGFDPHNVLTFKVALEGERYQTTAQTTAFYRETLQRIKGLPGVTAAAITNKLPLDWQFNMPVVFADQPDKFQSVQFRMISPDYFKVMKIPVRQGREFGEADNLAGQPAVIINEAFARRYFDGQSPFSRQFSIGRGLGDP
jgi:predicted permease